MLNRGEAPAAQLFKISEQAEIRYTNNGLLYEVPADEVASNPSSANSQPLGSGSARLASRCVPVSSCTLAATTSDTGSHSISMR